MADAEYHVPDVGREAIARWLKAAREAAGKTQREAGNFLDVDSQTVSNWETARHPIGAEDLLRLAVFYGADVGELMPPKRSEAPRKVAERPRGLGDMDLPPIREPSEKPKRRNRPA